jgi:hypothetical protein
VISYRPTQELLLLTIKHGAKEDLGGRVRSIGYKNVSSLVGMARPKLTRIRLKHSVGAATLLIHMLAKQDTPMNDNKTVLGRVPAKLRTRVISRRSIFVLLSADAIVNPPISNMIVGENITEKIYLQKLSVTLQGSSPNLLGRLRGAQAGIIAVR